MAEHASVLGMSAGGEGFELIAVADVIYAVEVVSMLFGTVDALLKAPARGSDSVAQFVMCQSFPYDVATEAEIDRCAALANLRREVGFDRLHQQNEDGWRNRL